MKIAKTIALHTLLISLTLGIEALEEETAQIEAQEQETAMLGAEAQEQEPAQKKMDCSGAPKPMRVTARHIEPGGIGYGLGYTTLEGFFPLYNGWDNWVLFVDGRGHVFNDGRPAANAGLGVRYLKTNRVWGLNSYYDYRKTHRQHYNQVAAGLESLGRIWDFRLNGYLPVGEKKSHNYRTRFDEFKGHHAILRQKFEFALAGANAEVGAHVDTWRHFPLYFAAGPYYLTGHGKSTWGGEGRASVSIYDYLKLEGYTSYDHLFKWTCQGQVSLSYSFGPRKKVKMDNNRNCSDATAVAKRAYQSVDRFEIIPVSRKHRHTTAINPRTGDPYYFWFVDNTSHSNGTFESPANVLQSVIADVIYIFPGDGTTNGMNSGITLQNNQRLWGSGIAQTLPTTVGTVIVPRMSSRGMVDHVTVLPIITNLSPGASVITLGNNNEISGLFIENTTSSNAIEGTRVTNARVLNCSMGAALGQGSVGFSATDLAGKLKIDNCVFAQNVGVLLANSSTNLKAKISDSNFNDAAEAIDWTLSNAVRGTLKIKDSQMSTSATAIHLISEGTSSITVNIADSTIVANALGILMDASTATNATQNLSVKNSLINTNSQGIFVTQVGQLNVDLTDNTLVSTLASLRVDTHGGNASIAGTGNSITAFEDHSILFNQNAGNLTAAFENNGISSLAADAVHVVMLSAAGTHTLDMTGNTIEAISNGWNFTQQGTTASALWKNNTVISGNRGLLWTANTNATETNLVFDDNNISALIAPILGTQSIGQLNLSVTDNQLIGGNEVLALTLNNSGTVFNMSKNTLLGGFGGEQLLIAHTLGTFSASITENTFSSGGSANYFYSGTGLANNSFQQIAGNTFFSGENANILINWASGDTMDATITGNTFQSAAHFSVTSSIFAGSQMLNLSDNTLVNTGGFQLIARDGSQATWFVNDNDFIVNGNRSPNPFISAAAIGSANVCMQLNDNTAYPTAGAYVLTNFGAGTFILNPPQDDIGEITTTNVLIGKCP